MRSLGPDVRTAYLLNIFLGVLDVALLASFARRVAGARVACAAAWLATLYGPFLYYESQAMPTTLAITLALVSLVALAACGGAPPASEEEPGPRMVRARPEGPGSRGALRPAPLLVAGLATGLLVLARPSFLLWLAVAALWVLGSGARHRRRGALLLVATALAVVGPVTWRNHVRSGSWVLVSANGGINFYLGNNPDADRTSTLRPGLEWEELVTSLPAEERAGQARWDRAFAARGRAWVREHPLDFLAGLGKKSLQYASAHEIDRNLDVRGFRARSRILRAAPTYAWIAPWVLLGLVVGWRRGGAARLAVLFWTANAASTVLFFVTERYRLDAAPSALLLALLALVELAALVRPRLGRARIAARLPGPRHPATSPAWAAALVVLGVALAFGDPAGVRRVHPAHAAELEGVAHYKEGRYGAAIGLLREALREDPNDADAHYQLGTALQKQNRLQEALVEYDTARRIAPRNPKPLVNAGWVRRALGDTPGALECYRQASDLRPEDASLHLETALLLEETGRIAEARARFETAARLAADPALRAEARQGLARCERVLGAPAR